jgi:bifunctional DNA-binding transcriptional regulator/antitoxin component of YhaV-PrlF toxin-antitoxin module
MVKTTIKLWGKGAVTLPKKWREKYDTEHFLAQETKDGGLYITPIRVEYSEDKITGTFGLQFPDGIDIQEFVHIMNEHGVKEHGKKKYEAMLKAAKIERKGKRRQKK